MFNIKKGLNRNIVKKKEAVSAVIGIILMVAITVAVAATVYIYVSGMLGAPTATAPKISWTPNLSTDTITITRGAIEYTYAADTNSPNIVFRNETGVTFFVQADADNTRSLSTTFNSCETDVIAAGDIIENFADGISYTIIWLPTHEVLGTFIL